VSSPCNLHHFRIRPGRWLRRYEVVEIARARYHEPLQDSAESRGAPGGRRAAQDQQLGVAHSVGGARRVGVRHLIEQVRRRDGRFPGRGTLGRATRPGNSLSAEERRRVITIATSREFRDASPKQIVPTLADRGEYVASESTMSGTPRRMASERSRSVSAWRKDSADSYSGLIGLRPRRARARFRVVAVAVVRERLSPARPGARVRAPARPRSRGRAHPAPARRAVRNR